MTANPGAFRRVIGGDHAECGGHAALCADCELQRVGDGAEPATGDEDTTVSLLLSGSDIDGTVMFFRGSGIGK